MDYSLLPRLPPVNGGSLSGAGCTEQASPLETKDASICCVSKGTKEINKDAKVIKEFGQLSDFHKNLLRGLF